MASHGSPLGPAAVACCCSCWPRLACSLALSAGLATARMVSLSWGLKLHVARIDGQVHACNGRYSSLTRAIRVRNAIRSLIGAPRKKNQNRDGANLLQDPPSLPVAALRPPLPPRVADVCVTCQPVQPRLTLRPPAGNPSRGAPPSRGAVCSLHRTACRATARPAQPTLPSCPSDTRAFSQPLAVCSLAPATPARRHRRICSPHHPTRKSSRTRARPRLPNPCPSPLPAPRAPLSPPSLRCSRPPRPAAGPPPPAASAHPAPPWSRARHRRPATRKPIASAVQRYPRAISQLSLTAPWIRFLDSDRPRARISRLD